MKHLDDGELILYHYRDASGIVEASRHLESCPECHDRLERLSATLSVVEFPEVPPRAEDYGTQIWKSIRAHLPEPQPRASLVWWRRFAVATAFAGLLVAAFLLGRHERPQPQQVAGSQSGVAATNTSVDAKQVQERVLLVALGDHLDRSQMLLIELSHAGGSGEVDISNQQQLAAQLALSNRLYRDTAQEVGDTAMSNALDELERVLLEITHEPSSLTTERLQQIQQRIQNQGILFKVRVIQNNVQRELAPSNGSKKSKENI